MFNIGPMELVVLAIVGLIVMGPDRLPELTKDAARMLRTLREMATGARTQLRDELGPEFADVDLRNLNPRTAISRAILGDDADRLTNLNPRNAMQNMLFGGDEPAATAAEPGPAADPAPAPSLHKTAPVSPPLGRGEQAPYDADAT